MTVFPSPGPTYCKELETKMFHFVWGGKRDKLKRATLKSKYRSGGLMFPDIQETANSLKMTWVRKFLDQENKAKWKAVVKDKLTVCNNTSIFNCNASKKQVENFVQSNFWRETISTWMSIKENQDANANEILDEVLWNNTCISLENRKTLNKKHLIEKGIVKVIDIYDTRQKRLLTANELGAKFALHPMMSLIVLRAIPRSWKEN